MAAEELPDPEVTIQIPRRVELVEERLRGHRANRLANVMAALFVLFTALWVVLLGVASWPALRLRYAGRDAEGVVTKKERFEPSVHLARPFQFRLTFKFTDQAGNRVPASAPVTEEVFSRTREGDSIQVRYDPAHAGRWLEIPGQTVGVARFVPAAGVQLAICTAFAIMFRMIPRWTRARLLRLCTHGTASAGTVMELRRRFGHFGVLAKVAHRTEEKEQIVCLRLTPAQAEGFAVGTRLTLLRHPTLWWIVMPYRLAPYRVVQDP